MKLAPVLALCLPLAFAPGLGGCVLVAGSHSSDYEQVLEVVPLRNATAAELAEMLRGLTERPEPSDGRWAPVLIAVDPRTNSLVLRGPRARVRELKKTIAELDRAM